MKTEPRISIPEFEALLPKVCSAETSADAAKWTPKNPLYGHCAVVTVIAQELFGGKILRADLDPKANMGSSHYLNSFYGVDGYFPHDFTKSQFGEKGAPWKNPSVDFSERDRRGVLYAPPGTPEERVKLFDRARGRYKLLKLRIEEHLSGYNPLFKDEHYVACYFEALESECQKMWFGCYGAADGGTAPLSVFAHNKPFDCTRGVFCEPKCARFDIPSRTESMIGDCGHAEEWALDGLRHTFGSKLTLWVAGCYPDGKPAMKTEKVFTCIRCALQIYRAGASVWVPVVDHWELLTGEEAVRTAIAFAKGEKKA